MLLFPLSFSKIQIVRFFRCTKCCDQRLDSMCNSLYVFFSFFRVLSSRLLFFLFALSVALINFTRMTFLWHWVYSICVYCTLEQCLYIYCNMKSRFVSVSQFFVSEKKNWLKNKTNSFVFSSLFTTAVNFCLFFVPVSHSFAVIHNCTLVSSFFCRNLVYRSTALSFLLLLLFANVN